MRVIFAVLFWLGETSHICCAVPLSAFKLRQNFTETTNIWNETELDQVPVPQTWQVPQTSTFIDFTRFTEPLVIAEAEYILIKASQEMSDLLKNHRPEDHFQGGRYEMTFRNLRLRIDELSMVTRAGPYLTYQSLKDTISGLSIFFSSRKDQHVFECVFKVEVPMQDPGGITNLFEIAHGVFYEMNEEEEVFETS